MNGATHDLQPAQQAFARLRQGVGTDRDWMRLHGIVLTSASLASQGVCRGVDGHLANAQCALQEIHRRALDLGTWPVPHLAEIEAIDTAVDLYGLQLELICRDAA